MNIAQLVIGIGIGARFVGVSVIRLYKVILAGAGATILMVALAAVAAWVLSTGPASFSCNLACLAGGRRDDPYFTALGNDVAFVSTIMQSA